MRRAHLGLVVVAVALAGGLITLLGVAALRAYTEHNLQLIARSAGYMAEAAVVFQDRTAATEALSLIAQGEGLSELRISDPQGHLFAQWQQPPHSTWDTAWTRVAELLLPAPTTMPMVRDGQVIAQVYLRSDGGGLMRFLLSGMAALLVCLLVAVTLSLQLSRRLLRQIIGPLHNMARVTHAVRHDGAYGQRVPAARIAELDAFGEDLNALLGELEQRQARLQRKNAKLAHKASHDGLTGLPNRATFERRLEHVMRRIRNTGAHLAVLYLDCDSFKAINDDWGHAAGDAVLCAVASRMQAQVRKTDMVARLGGDEFGVLLSPLRSVSDVQRIVLACISSMDEWVELPGGTGIRVSITVGIALFPDHADNPQSLLRSADAAMYQAKRTRPGSSAMAQNTA
ncbi:MAG TPA: diguanylate cyclase, partial [Burkholderiaceae bacterium]